jgi:hypothetical protein
LLCKKHFIKFGTKDRHIKLKTILQVYTVIIISSEVPQGSVFGPLLCISYTHDFPQQHKVIKVLLSRNTTWLALLPQLQAFLAELKADMGL